MRRILVSILWVLCFFGVAHVCAGENIEVVIPDGKKVLLKSDNTWIYLEGSTVSVKDPSSVEDVLEVWDSSVEHLSKDSDENRYSNEVRLHLHYKNISGSKVIAVVTYVRVMSPLGKVLLEDTFEDESIVLPGTMERNAVYWKYTDNPFTNDELYDVLWQAAKNGTAQIKTQVKKVVLENGKVLLPRKIKSLKK